MSVSGLVCNVCSLESASVGCICFKGLQLIGSLCLTRHIQECKATHYVISLSVASNLSSHPNYILRYLTSSISSTTLSNTTPHTPLSSSSDSLSKSGLFCSNSPTISPISVYHLSNIKSPTNPPTTSDSSVPSSSSLPPISSQPSTSIKSFHSDLEKSLFLHISPTSSTFQHLYYTNYSFLFIYDTISNKLSSVNLPFNNSISAPIHIYKDILFLQADVKSLVTMKFDVKRKRFYKMNLAVNTNSWKLYMNNEEYLYMVKSYGANNFRRYNFMKNRVEILPRLRYKKTLPCFVSLGNKIMLLEENAQYIQYFNTSTKKYYSSKHSLDHTDLDFSPAISIKNMIFQSRDGALNIYDLQLNKLQEISCSEALSTNITQYATSGLDLYHISSYDVLESISLSPSSTCKDTLQDSYTTQNNRYIYLLGCMGLVLFQINLQFKVANLSIDNGEAYFPILGACKCANGKIVIIVKGFWAVWNADGEMDKFEGYRRMSEEFHDEFVVVTYHEGFCYVFFAHSVMRIELESKKCEKMLDLNPSYIREKAFCVGIGPRIYIIGGGIASIDMYDLATNSYSEDIYRLDHNHAVAMVFEERMIILSRNTYRVFDQDLNEIERGISNCDNYDVIATSTVEIYRQKAYFYNEVSKCLEYYDVRTHERGVEALRNCRISRTFHLGS